MISTDKVIAYIPLFYGSCYLKEAIQSVAPFVDKIMVFYTDRPSYGFGTEITCPDTEEKLRNIAESESDKIQWVKGQWSTEGEHREEILKYSNGYDVILTFDADEVFNQDDLPVALENVSRGTSRYWGVEGYINFWKTFDWEVKDFFRPIRFINLKEGNFGQSEVHQTIYHFSCCQSDEIMNFKYEVHGHKNEISCDWLRDKYYAWTPENKITFLHPSSQQVWGDAFAYDKTQLPQSLKNHANYNKTI